MSSDFHAGEYQTLPRRVPMESLATWDRTVPPPVPVPPDAEAAYLSPGRPPWVPEEEPIERLPYWVWALIFLIVLDAVILVTAIALDT